MIWNRTHPRTRNVIGLVVLLTSREKTPVISIQICFLEDGEGEGEENRLVFFPRRG